jgi:hypothetical protein
MKTLRNFRFSVSLGLVVALAGTLFAQSTSDKVLVVNGKTVDSGVLQIGGRSYVDVETIAQLTNGSFVVDPHRVVLNIPAGNAPAATPVSATTPAPAAPPAHAAPATKAATTVVATTPDATVSVPANAAPAAQTAADKATAEVTAPNGGNPVSASAAAAANQVAEAAAEAATPAPPAPPKGISRQFASVSVATLADMREWRGAISAMISHGLAVSDAWAGGYRDQAQADLAQAEVAANTDDDRSALQLLRNEESNLESWWNTVLAQRQDLNGASTIDPDALKNDPMLAKIRSCSQFLNSMIVSGAYSDSSACH